MGNDTPQQSILRRCTKRRHYDRHLSARAVTIMHPVTITVAKVGTVCLITATAVGQGLVQEAPEPNSFPRYTAIQCGQQGEGTIGVAGDVDYWRLQVGSPTSITVFTGPGYLIPRCADTIL